MTREAVGARRFVQLTAGLAFAFVAACTTSVDPPAVATVAFTSLSDSVLVGGTYQTNFQAKDAAGVELNRTIAYESLHPAIATVDNKGLVSGVAVGTATIRGSVDGRSATMQVKVLEKVTRVVLVPQNDNVPIGGTRTLTVTLTGASGASIAGRSVNFQSNNPSVATVNAQGVVSGVTKGQATITASAQLDQVVGTATINVTDVTASSVTLTPVGAQILRLGSTLQATATARDNNNNVLPGRTFTWSSSNPSVATVTQAGLITTVALGNATITAEVDGRTANMAVQVTEVPPKSVALDPDTVAIGTGTSRLLLPVVIDSLNRVVNSLATRSVLWQSSNPAVASVSSSGMVSALTGGVARISVTVDNVRSNDVVFIITDQVNSVRLTPGQTPPMRVGNTLQVTAQALNNQNNVLPGKTFTWTSSNPSVATVSSSGLVSALATGNVTITAETEGKTANLGIQVTLVPIGSVVIPAFDTLITGDVKQYNPVVRDSAGRLVTSMIGRTVNWTSTNIPVAGVTNLGIVQASNVQGNAQIGVTIDGVASNTLALRVSQLADIIVNPTAVTVKIANSVQLNVILHDGAGNTVTTTRSIIFQANGPNASRINVSPTGAVTGVTAGASEVKVTVQGITGVEQLVTVNVIP